MAGKGFAAKARGLMDNVRYYWKEPPKGKYMPIKEVAAYAFGGIGAYFIIQLGSTLIVSTTNIIVANAIGVGPMHSYVIYLIATILNIPLTAVRANMVDNTRGKGGKYRPYLLSMGIPTAIIALIYVWFPYEQMYHLFPGKIFGYDKGYWIKVAVVFICNLALHFFFNFFRDAYENLIHVLSPNTQERTDVLAVKAVVYSLAPSIMNILNPVIAKYFADNNQTNLIVYRITYPIYAVVGIALTIVVFANTREKIVQAKTHTIQISFMDSLKEVAKNKYFWIIALAGWLGFLELAYANILLYNQSYGHTVDGNMYALAWTVIGNASLWGMLFAPFFVKKFGKKRVLITVNLANVVCILLMIVNVRSFWWLVACVWANYLFGSVEQITTPAIQADIRDFQQYKSGERIDGMFAAVATIGNVVTLATSAVLPAIQEKFGIFEGNGYEKPFDILDITNGQDGLLYKFLPALIIMAAVGAFLNVVPYFFYDFDEKKQKSVIRVLQVRALFEDYANGALKNRQLVEAIDLVENAREMAVAEPKQVSKDDYRNAPKSERKEAKKAYREALAFNEEIEISKFVCEELDKFDSDLGKYQIEVYRQMLSQNLDFINSINAEGVKEEIAAADALPKTTKEERQYRRFRKDFAKSKRSAKRAHDKYYGSVYKFIKPDMAALTALFDKEDELDEAIYEANQAGDKAKAKELIKEKKAVQKDAKALMDEFAKFGRAAKPLNDAEKFLKQYENYSKFDEIAALYDEAKAEAEREEKEAEEERERAIAAEKAELEAKKSKKK
ncbi:MAG: MFS transporter [Eubacterium sp.]|nr:MFS transporter [Eubacterium sp.]